MGLSFSIAIYFVVWWMVLFVVLPFGVRTQDEAGEVVPGTPPSAPRKPPIGRIVLITTVLATIVFAVIYLGITQRWIRLQDVPILR